MQRSLRALNAVEIAQRQEVGINLVLLENRGKNSGWNMVSDVGRGGCS